MGFFLYDSIKVELFEAGTIVDDSELFENWVSSGSLNLSDYSGTGYVAFKYTGGDNNNDEDGTYELDNFRLLGM